jgi:hypothetical protein
MNSYSCRSKTPALPQTEKVQKQDDESAGIFHALSLQQNRAETRPKGTQIIITHGVAGDAGV